MLKQVVMTGAMIVALPAFAQTGTGNPNTATGAVTDQPQGGDAVTGAPSGSVQPGQTGQEPHNGTSNTQSTESAAGQTQASGGNQIATVVDSEFSTYDKDANGSLNKAEFAAWMNALKAKQPNGAGAMADPKWNDAAFVQADKDKSAVVTKAELTAFLSGGNSRS